MKVLIVVLAAYAELDASPVPHPSEGEERNLFLFSKLAHYKAKKSHYKAKKSGWLAATVDHYKQKYWGYKAYLHDWVDAKYDHYNAKYDYYTRRPSNSNTSNTYITNNYYNTSNNNHYSSNTYNSDTSPTPDMKYDKKRAWWFDGLSCAKTSAGNSWPSRAAYCDEKYSWCVQSGGQKATCSAKRSDCKAGKYGWGYDADCKTGYNGDRKAFCKDRWHECADHRGAKKNACDKRHHQCVDGNFGWDEKVGCTALPRKQYCHDWYSFCYASLQGFAHRREYCSERYHMCTDYTGSNASCKKPEYWDYYTYGGASTSPIVANCRHWGCGGSQGGNTGSGPLGAYAGYDDDAAQLEEHYGRGEDAAVSGNARLTAVSVLAFFF